LVRAGWLRHRYATLGDAGVADGCRTAGMLGCALSTFMSEVGAGVLVVVLLILRFGGVVREVEGGEVVVERWGLVRSV